jgi:pimeloyl-ACP methyl ester carboxylesterase
VSPNDNSGSTPEAGDGQIESFDGLELAYRLYGRGAGRSLMLLHGGGANLVSMDQFAERLGADRTTVALALRACGQSGDPDRFAWPDAIRDVESIVTQLRLGPVDIIGHSMGGFVAGFYALEHPDSRVVSIDGFESGPACRRSAMTRIDRPSQRSRQA